MNYNLLFAPPLFRKTGKEGKDSLYRSFTHEGIPVSPADQWLEEANLIPASGYYLQNREGIWETVEALNRKGDYPPLYLMPQIGEKFLLDKRALISEATPEMSQLVSSLKIHEAQYIYLQIEGIGLREVPDYYLAEEERSKYLPFLEDDRGRALLEAGSFVFYVSWSAFSEIGPLSAQVVGLAEVSREISCLYKIVRA